MSRYLSLRCIASIPKEHKDVINSLDQKELGNLLEYVKAIKEVSARHRDNLSDFARINSWEGDLYRYKHNENQVIVGKKSDSIRMGELGWKQGDLIGGGLCYYSRTFNPTSTYSQGIMQIINENVGSFNNLTGRTNNGRVVGQVRANAGVTTRLPVYNKKGKVVRYDIPMPSNLETLDPYFHNLVESLVTEVGRREEVGVSKIVNENLVNCLYDMWDKAQKGDRLTRESSFINLVEEAKRDKVLQQTLELIPPDLLKALYDKFGENTIMVRKDVLQDCFGERTASVADIFTGNTRWGPRAQAILRDSLKAFLGKRAFEHAVNAEKIIQGVMTNARKTIVVKSVIVPAMNFAANFVQLTMHGISPFEVAKQVPRKIAEIERYIRLKKEQLDLRAEIDLDPTNDSKVQQLNARINMIDGEIRSMSSYPLLMRGEYSSIMDIAINTQDIDVLRDSFGFIERRGGR